MGTCTQRGRACSLSDTAHQWRGSNKTQVCLTIKATWAPASEYPPTPSPQRKEGSLAALIPGLEYIGHWACLTVEQRGVHMFPPHFQPLSSSSATCFPSECSCEWEARGLHTSRPRPGNTQRHVHSNCSWDSFNGSRGLIQERNQSEWQRPLPPCTAVPQPEGHGDSVLRPYLDAFLVFSEMKFSLCPLRFFEGPHSLSSLLLCGLITRSTVIQDSPWSPLSTPRAFLSWSRGSCWQEVSSSRNGDWQVMSPGHPCIQQIYFRWIPIELINIPWVPRSTRQSFMHCVHHPSLALLGPIYSCFRTHSSNKMEFGFLIPSIWKTTSWRGGGCIFID